MFSLEGRELATPADRLGKYELLGRLAIGGMAEIFLAKAGGIEGFEKLAVLKKILPQYAQNTSFVSMFLAEARLAATLNHPNIAHVYDIGVVAGSYFFTMEYIHGENLRSIQKGLRNQQRGLPIEHALSIVCGICSGLHYAHERIGPDGKPLGIVHRDVSPSNVLVTFDGGVKVVDFGIAKATKKYKQTKGGTLKGKLSYMSPEQTRGDEIDRRSDIFSIGILLYELSTGTRLYPGDNEYAVMNKIVHEDAPPPTTRLPSYPPELERIVMKALQRDPDERWQNAEAMHAAIEDFATEHRIRISPLSLSRLMDELFGKKIEAWHAAQAAGKSLEEHVAATVVRDLTGSDPSRSRSSVHGPRDVTTGPIDKVDLADDLLAEDIALVRRRAIWPWLMVCAIFMGLGAIGGYYVLGAPAPVATAAPAPVPAAVAAPAAAAVAAPAPAAAPDAAPVADPDAVAAPVATPAPDAAPVADPDPDGSRVPSRFAGHPGPEPAKKKRVIRRRPAGDSADDSPFESD